MARLWLPTQAPVPGSWPHPLDAYRAHLFWRAAGADFAQGFAFDWASDVLLLLHNPSGAPRTVTLSSTPAAHTQRTGDIANYALDAGAFAVFGAHAADGWKQTASGQVYGQASAADVELAVLSAGTSNTLGFLLTEDGDALATEDGYLLGVE